MRSFNLFLCFEVPKLNSSTTKDDIFCFSAVTQAREDIIRANGDHIVFNPLNIDISLDVPNDDLFVSAQTNQMILLLVDS